MIWQRVSPYAGRSGIWTITELVSKGVSGFLLYRENKIIDRFDTKDEAKAKADELEQMAEV